MASVVIALERCMDCPFQSNDWWCRRSPSPTAEELREADEMYRADGNPDSFKVRGYTGPGEGPPPSWCPLRATPITLEIRKDV